MYCKTMAPGGCWTVITTLMCTVKVFPNYASVILRKAADYYILKVVNNWARSQIKVLPY